jgi:hypothetical protein
MNQLRKTKTSLFWRLHSFILVWAITVSIIDGNRAVVSAISSNYLRKGGSSSSTAAARLPYSFVNNKQSQSSFTPAPYEQPFVNSNNNNNNNNEQCPTECTCQGLSIDCSGRVLTQVPKNIPKNVIKV